MNRSDDDSNARLPWLDRKRVLHEIRAWSPIQFMLGVVAVGALGLLRSLVLEADAASPVDPSQKWHEAALWAYGGVVVLLLWKYRYRLGPSPDGPQAKPPTQKEQMAERANRLELIGDAIDSSTLLVAETLSRAPRIERDNWDECEIWNSTASRVLREVGRRLDSVGLSAEIELRISAPRTKPREVPRTRGYATDPLSNAVSLARLEAGLKEAREYVNEL